MAIGSSPDFDESTGFQTTSYTMSNTPTNGKYLILTRNASTATFSSLTSITQTNVSWARVGSVYSVNRKIEVWLGTVSASPGTGLTFAFDHSGTDSFAGGQIAQWSGLSGVVDVTTTGASANTTTPTTASITPTGGTNVLIIAADSRIGTYSSGPTGGFTDYTSAAASQQRTAYQVVASASGSYQAVWTYSPAAAWDAVIVAFAAAGGGGGSGIAALIGGKLVGDGILLQGLIQ